MKSKIIKFLGALLIAITLIQCQSNREKNMVLLPVKNDPTISFRFVFKTGAAFDPQGKEGLAALTTAMITQGATRKHSYDEILQILYPMAASISGQTDKEMVVISGRVHKDNLAEFYQILKEGILEPAFAENDFKRIKSNMVNYIQNNLRYSSDEELGKAALYEFIFEGTPYGHLNTGHLKSLKAITLNDVKDFYKRYFTRANLIIGLGGGFDEKFVRQVAADFKALPEGTPTNPPVVKPKPIEGIEVLIVEKKGASATAISFGFPIDILRGQKDFYALALANSWFGEHRNSSSHLYQVIREARGLNYGDYSYIEYFPNGGRRQFPPANVARHHQIFEVWIRPVPNEARLFAFRAALRELDRLVNNGLTEDQFKLTQEFLGNYILHYAPTTMLKLGYAIDDLFYGIEGHYLNLFPERIRNLTREQVNQAVKKHLQTKNMKVVFVTSNAEELKQMLVTNQPSPISYHTPKPQSILNEDLEIAAYPLKIPAQKVKIVKVEEMFK